MCLYKDCSVGYSVVYVYEKHTKRNNGNKLLYIFSISFEEMKLSTGVNFLQ